MLRSRPTLLAAALSLLLPATLVSGAPENASASAPTVPATATACDPDPDVPKRQFRAMWIASVANLDWPSQPGLSAAAQQAEFRTQLDVAEQYDLNAVVLQVRPAADAFWPSPHEPWSEWLTGNQGGDPGYDPLAYAVEQAHARDIELHAWFNPYRVATHDDPSQLHPGHPARQHPEWVFPYGGQLYYNPGVPDVRDHVTDAMMHAVTNYDIDAVHWDDYFYPYPVDGESIPDQHTYDQYGADFDSIEDWRRDNVNRLVQRMGQRIEDVKPWVRFGVSPFGIWRNASSDPRGSATSGLQSYDAVFADSRRWVRQEWVDYVAPQVYWHLGFPVADYAELVPWWSDVVDGTDVQLYVGQATYRAGAPGEDPAWQAPDELSDHLYLNRDHPQVRGDIHFRAGHVAADPIGAVSTLADDHYARPALAPARSGGAPPDSPEITSATRTGTGVELSWQPAMGDEPTSYAVYRVPGDGPVDPCAFADAAHLIGTARDTGFTDGTAGGGTYTYYVTALDRTVHESEPSPGAVVGDGGGDFETVVHTGSPGRFTASASWGVSSYSPESYGDSYRFAEPTPASDPAWFRLDLPDTGDYRVEVWYPSSSGYHQATPYLIDTTGGLEVVHVDQRVDGGQWVDLGVYELAGGDRDVVGVSRWAGGSGYVIADAVRVTGA